MAPIAAILAHRNRWLDSVASGRPGAAFVQTTLERCRDAVAQLGSQLVVLGYPWRKFLTSCSADLEGRVTRIEKHTGIPIPTVVHEFWRIVGGIAFVDLRQYRHVVFWDAREITGAHGFCDGVYVDACDANWEDYTTGEFDNWAEDGEEESFRYSMAPDGYHKDDISGGPHYALGRGSEWAPACEDFRWAGYRRPETATADPPDFISYLRTAILECAGFPGFLGHPGFEAIRTKLVRDLPPF